VRSRAVRFAAPGDVPLPSASSAASKVVARATGRVMSSMAVIDELAL
jgi:hypothetical protein